MSNVSRIANALRPTNVAKHFILRSEFAIIFLNESAIAKRIVELIARNRIKRLIKKVDRNISAEAHGIFAASFPFGTLYLDMRNIHDKLMYHEAMYSGGYEKGLTSVVSSTVRQGDTCVDVGANNGYYTLLLSKLCGNDGRVLSFEPTPSSFNRLYRNVSLNRLKNVSLYRMALGDSMRKLVLLESDMEDGLNYVTENGAISGSLIVTQMPLDVIVKERKIDFVKIDVEGYELDVLKGMKRTIDKNPSIQICLEYNLNAQLRAGHGPDDLLAYLFSIGFRVHEIVDTGLGKEPINSKRDLSGLLTNLYCTKQ